MPNGSEDSGMVMQVTMPGYKMPEGADVSTEEGFRVWVDSVHPFVSSHLADRLIDRGYDRISSAYGISEGQLIDVVGVKEGHAVQFVQAAERLRRALGHADEVTTSNAGVYHKKRTPPPKIPVAAKGSQGCGVAGLGDVADVRAWLTQLMSWARSNYGPEEAKTIESIALCRPQCPSAPTRASPGVLIGTLPSILFSSVGFYFARATVAFARCMASIYY